MRTIAGIMSMALACVAAYGQTADSKVTYEVVSVKPSPPPDGRGMRVGCTGGPGSPDPGRLACQNMSLSNFVTMAYNLKRYEYSGQPWMEMERFDLTAKFPEGTTKEQGRLMMQNMLAERFKLTFHRETKEMPVYEMSVVKGGLKMKESVPEPPKETGDGPSAPPSRQDGPPKFQLDKDGFPTLPPGRGYSQIMMNGRARMRAPEQTMAQIAATLSGQLGKPVKDVTGLTGKYDLLLSWSSDNLSAGRGGGPSADGSIAIASDDNGPNIYTAVQEQLGLKLDQKKGQVEVLVVDHVEKVPTEN